MTVRDLRCDLCGCSLVGPAVDETPADRAAVTLVYHPGRRALGDTSGLICQRCKADVVGGLGADKPQNRCAVCGSSVTRFESLHVLVGGEPGEWQLCASDAVAFLNRLRTVEPKLVAEQFRFPLASRS
jgi:hypothetical protein